jgi:hypothetical protein
LKLASANIFHSTCKFMNHSYCLNNYHPMKKKRFAYTVHAGRNMTGNESRNIHDSFSKPRTRRTPATSLDPTQPHSLLHHLTSTTASPDTLPPFFFFQKHPLFLAAEGYHNSSIRNHTGGTDVVTLCNGRQQQRLNSWLRWRSVQGEEERSQERRRDSPFFFVPAVPSCVISIDPRYPGTVSTESSIVY